MCFYIIFGFTFHLASIGFPLGFHPYFYGLEFVPNGFALYLMGLAFSLDLTIVHGHLPCFYLLWFMLPLHFAASLASSTNVHR